MRIDIDDGYGSCRAEHVTKTCLLKNGIMCKYVLQDVFKRLINIDIFKDIDYIYGRVIQL